MKIKQLALTSALLFSLTGTALSAHAESETLDGHGHVTVEGGVTDPVNPEEPEELVEPGEGPATEGPLRFDYVSSLDFGRANVNAKDRTFLALAQQYLGDAEPTGGYVQVTDQRPVSTGWTLQVKQNYQFRNSVIQETDEQELTGAVLSLDKAWANSSGTSEAPIVTRETVAINGIGTAYELANAEPGSGQGVWTIEFGASETNQHQQENTLSLLLDENGQSVTDSFSGKPAYTNSAITLTVPKKTKIHPVQYTTELTWLLTAAP